jgi:hypothetical protein
LLVYNTTENCFNYFNTITTTWKSMCTATGIINSGDTVILNLLKADSIFAHYLKVDSAFITNLFATYIKADSAYIKSLVSNYIKSDSAYINLLRTDSIFTTYLQAHYIKTDSIYAHLGRFDSLVIKGLSIDSLIKQITSSYLNSKDTVVLKYLRADLGSFDSLIIKGLTIDSLIQQITTNYLNSKDTVVINYLLADSIYAYILLADTAVIGYINANTIKVDTIIGGFASFDSLYVDGKNILSIISDSINSINNSINISIGNKTWLLVGNNATAASKLGTLNAQNLNIITNNTDRISIMSTTGNVGIGQTLPSAKLDVLGNIQFFGDLKPGGSPGTSGQLLTSAGLGVAPIWKTLPPPTVSNTLTGTNITTTVNGVTGAPVDLSAIIPPDTNIYNNNGTLTSNRILNQGGKQLSITNGHLTIGATDGQTTAGERLLIRGDTPSANLYQLNVAGATNTNQWLTLGYDTQNDYGKIQASKLSTGDMPLVLNPHGGSVGVGNITPAAKLDIAGNIKITDGTEGVGKVLTSDGTGLATWATPASSGVMGSGTLNFVPKWTPNGTILGNSQIFDNGTNIGIGTTAPLYTLNVTRSLPGTFLGAFHNTNVNGTGLSASGENALPLFLPTGSAAAFSAVNTAILVTTSSPTGNSIIALGNGLTTYGALATGTAGSFFGTNIGLYGSAANSTSAAGGYFTSNVGINYAYVGFITAGGVAQKINGPGAVSTIVKNTKNELVNLYCPEAPEVLFQDFGKGTLVNGVAHINMDEVFCKNVTINDKHPLRVIIQLEGDCKGVFVTNKTKNSFDVKELQNGTSTCEFTYFVTANRADAYNDDGTLFSKFENVRYGEAPGPAKTANEQKVIAPNNTTKSE